MQTHRFLRLCLFYFDIAVSETLVKLIIEFLALPASETAKRYALEKVALNVCADAPPEVRQKIKQETPTLDVSMPPALPPAVARDGEECGGGRQF